MGVLAGAASLSPSILTLKSKLSENIDQISNNVQYYGCSDGPTLSLINIEVSYIVHDHNLFNSYCLACHHCSLTRGKSTYEKYGMLAIILFGLILTIFRKRRRMCIMILSAVKLKSIHVRVGLWPQIFTKWWYPRHWTLTMREIIHDRVIFVEDPIGLEEPGWKTLAAPSQNLGRLK